MGTVPGAAGSQAAGTSNQLSGTVGGSAVQGRSIHGGVHVHSGPGTACTRSASPDLEGFVTAALQTSYDDLDRDTRRACRLLSLHPGPDFTAGAAGALLDTDTGTAEDLACVLAGASLLAETAEGWWRFHDLTGEHARQMAARHDSAPERAAAITRAVDYYLRGSAAANRQVLPGRLRFAAAFGLPVLNPPAHASTAEAPAWCDAEQASLLQSQQAAAGLGLHTLAWQFADTARGHVKSPVRPSAARRTRRPAAEPARTRRRIRGCQ